MKTKLISLLILPFLLGIGGLTALSIGFTNSANAISASDICGDDTIPKEVRQASGCNSVDAGIPDLKDVVTGIINGVIAVTGTVAVIFIVVGGVNFMTSSGDAQKVQKARNTIMYACIGLAICALSFVIVNFVIIDLIAGGGGGAGAGGAGAGTDVTGVEVVGDGNGSLVELVTGIINGVIAVLGTVCVIFMIIGGTSFMTSSGDTQKVQKAKNTLLYASIGLIICVLAFAVTNFVIANLIHGDAPAYVNQEECEQAGGNWVDGHCDV